MACILQMSNPYDMNGIPFGSIRSYPIPPYISLRDMIGRLNPPMVQPRLLLDMIRKYDANEGFVYVNETQIQEAANVYQKVGSFTSPIQDTNSRTLIYRKFQDSLTAENLQGSNQGANFEITTYSNGPPSGKTPITLKITSANLYLSCTPSGGLQKENVGSLDTIDDSKLRFLFFRTSPSKTTFESASAPGMFICTAGPGVSQVTVSPQDNFKIFDFRIRSEQVRSFMIFGDRIIVQNPWKEQSQLLNVGKLQWPNIYDGFTYGTSGDPVCW